MRFARGYCPLMSEEVRYRALIGADAGRVAELVRTAFASQTVVTDPLPSALLVTAADILAHLAGDGCGAVAESIAGIVGSALWSRKDGGLYVGRVAIDAAWRRRGIARRLLALAEDAARAANLPRVWLETRLVLTDNRRLFASSGFREISLHAHPGYSAPTFVRMEKMLARLD